MTIIKNALSFIFIIGLGSVHAQESSIELAPNSSSDANESSSETTQNDDTVYVIGSQEKAFYMPGSAHFIDKKELEKFQYNDVNRVLDKVPGVYIQEEDGQGLRPNIGLRGAHPHRSKKVTLMEDGILVGPAPYAAPAAYYFPSTSRLSSMEVFKGPSSVQYGPNSVGGAINMVTTPLQGPALNQVELSSGDWTQLQGMTRGQSGANSWALQIHRKEGDLQKSFSQGDDPNFEQNDFLLKWGYDLTKTGAGYGQKIEAKISYATEDSQETYLGVSPADFNQSAFTRYEASRDDRIEWQRWGAQVSYALNPTSALKTKTTVYHHQMHRNWNKFNDFANYQDFRSALRTGQDPDNLIPLLRGQRDSADSTESLRIGANDRFYFSQGVQSKAELEFLTGSWFHQLELGVRLHRDQVERNHSEKLALMQDGSLNYREGSFNYTNKTQDTADALAIFAKDEITKGNLTTSIGARVESVQNERNPRNGDSKIETEENVFVPGVGFNYSVSENIVALAGVNKGVTLVGPGQDPSVKPEEAINYEAGFRVNAPFNFEAVGFYSDYQNIKGTCSFSSGCRDSSVGEGFNGGKAEIYGLESMLSHELNYGKLNFPLRLGHTFTVARFKNQTRNSNPEWGPIEEGRNLIRVDDPLPYIPQNQFNLGAGLRFNNFSADLNLLWKDNMADQAIAEGRKTIPSYGVVDMAFAYQYSSRGRAFLRVNNILDNTYLVSYRPFGARPGSPRTVVAGFSQSF